MRAMCTDQPRLPRSRGKVPDGWNGATTPASLPSLPSRASGRGRSKIDA
ncbi:hypothetical protein L599_005800000040 [Luteimonas sp. J16]|nr:hypothetical protein L599_005800000040 [Luteimonas sp. J16]